MKGITPIIAIIVLLLITVALAGVAWSYLSGYMNTLTGKSTEVKDYFCAGGNAVIIVANTGTARVNTNEMTVFDAGSGTALAGTWSYVVNATPVTSIASSGQAKWSNACAGTCSYRVVSAGGRAQNVNVVC